MAYVPKYKCFRVPGTIIIGQGQEGEEDRESSQTMDRVSCESCLGAWILFYQRWTGVNEDF